jgi:hypothetical protein
MVYHGILCNIVGEADNVRTMLVFVWYIMVKLFSNITVILLGANIYVVSWLVNLIVDQYITVRLVDSHRT